MSYEPTVRTDVALLTHGRRGTDEDTLAIAAAVVIDAALAGVVDVTGRRVLRVDRRRVVLGATQPDEATDPLMASVRRRVEAGTSDSPWGWCERAAVFAHDAVADEVVGSGLARRRDVPVWRRVMRHRTLDVDDATTGAIVERLRRVADGDAPPADVALVLVLRETELLSESLRRREARHASRAADRAVDSLPEAARAVLDALGDRRRRAESIGTYYADD